MTTWIQRSDLGEECIEDCTRPGVAADGAVRAWRKRLSFMPPRDEMIRYLATTGAWSRADLEKDEDEELAERTLWLMCGNFNEDKEAESWPLE